MSTEYSVSVPECQCPTKAGTPRVYPPTMKVIEVWEWEELPCTCSRVGRQWCDPHGNTSTRSRGQKKAIITHNCGNDSCPCNCHCECFLGHEVKVKDDLSCFDFTDIRQEYMRFVFRCPKCAATISVERGCY